MADEGEDTESLQGLLEPPVNHSLETLRESELVGSECEGGLEGPFQTDQVSEESMTTTEASETDRLCLDHHEEEEEEREGEVVTVQQQQQQVVVGESEVGGQRPVASCDYRLQFSHGGELGGLLPVPEHELLPSTQEQPGEQLLLENGTSEMVMASSAASETVETHR